MLCHRIFAFVTLSVVDLFNELCAGCFVSFFVALLGATIVSRFTLSGSVELPLGKKESPAFPFADLLSISL